MFTIAPPKPKLLTRTNDADFSYNKRIENEYNYMLNAVSDEVNSILEYYDANDPGAVVDLLQVLQDYSNDLYSWASDFVGGLLYQLNDDDEKTWKKHSAFMSKKFRYELEHVPIKPIMQEYLKDNIGLIQSLPLNTAKKIQSMVLENLKTGEYRAEGLTEQIINLGNITRNRAKLIARTEVARISTGLTKARSEVLGLNYYIWKTSHDARVRSSHRLMDKVLIAWDNPAAPEALDPFSKKSYGHYHPGEIFNCRCFAQPLIRLEDISWPARIYMNGRIQNINKEAFMGMFQEAA